LVELPQPAQNLFFGVERENKNALRIPIQNTEDENF